MVFRPKSILVLAFCVLMVAATFYLLAFGVAVLYGAPTRPGQGFWQPEKFFYGLLPIFASPVILAATLKLWTRAFSRRRNAFLAGCAVVIFAVPLDTIVLLKLRNRQDDRIKVVWTKESGVFSWGTGKVRIPGGFTYEAENGIDTFVGRFISEDGKLIITHDIGELAGEHGGMGKSETLTEGSRVRIGHATYADGLGDNMHFSKVSFPDSGCANFYSESRTQEDTAAIEFIARGFRPIGWTPSFFRPLLPEILRSDCRYRLELPSSFLDAVDLLGDFVDRLTGQA